MLKLLGEVLDPFVIFKIDHERSITKERLLDCKNDLALYDDFESVWNEYADRVSSPVVICGSFYAVGKAIEYFGAYPETFSVESLLCAHDPRSTNLSRLKSDRSASCDSREEFSSSPLL
jgi:hypothetical protein